MYIIYKFISHTCTHAQMYITHMYTYTNVRHIPVHIHRCTSHACIHTQMYITYMYTYTDVHHIHRAQVMVEECSPGNHLTYFPFGTSEQTPFIPEWNLRSQIPFLLPGPFNGPGSPEGFHLETPGGRPKRRFPEEPRRPNPNPANPTRAQYNGRNQILQATRQQLTLGN